MSRYQRYLIIMRVFVRNMRGNPLMPCSNKKARLLLKEGKAKIYQYNPFTIQLCYATGENVQNCHVGIDTGAKHIGIAVTSEDKVLFKGEVELRQDVKSNIDTRRSYRKDRRNRKTRYRKARFLNRKKKDAWLPPSIENRINHTFKWIDTLLSLVPNPQLHIEVGKFDVAKMINPDIQGVDYQHGQTYGFYDVRYFVFARDNYTCQCCGKSKGKTLQTHHIIYRSNGGSNRADNLITVCTDCHTYENHQKGGVLYKWQENHKKTKQYKEPPFMNTLRKRIFKKYPNAVITYGSKTTPKRKELGLEKTHYNDAIVISGIITEKGFIYTFKKELIENKNKDSHFIIATCINYFISLIIWSHDYSWNISNVELSESIITFNMAILMLTTLILGFLNIFDPIEEFELYKVGRKIYHNEYKNHSTNQHNLNDTIKPEPIIKNSKFEQIADDIQNYIDAIAIQAFNQYEPQKHVLNALVKAKKDIQQIAKNYETRQQIDDNDNLTHYFKQAEQIKENAKKLCHEFLDYVEQHKALSSTKDIQNIQTILEKLNHKGE